MIHDGDYCGNVDSDKIPSLLAARYTEDCIDALSTLHLI